MSVQCGSMPGCFLVRCGNKASCPRRPAILSNSPGLTNRIFWKDNPKDTFPYWRRGIARHFQSATISSKGSLFSREHWFARVLRLSSRGFPDKLSLTHQVLHTPADSRPCETELLFSNPGSSQTELLL